jgi:hypothetical protein
MGNEEERAPRSAGWGGLRYRLGRWWREIFYLTGTMVGFSASQPAQEGTNAADSDPERAERRFAPEVLDLLLRAPAVEIETRRAPGAPPYRAPILTVADAEGRVYSRCSEGMSGYWYRRILINSGVTLHVGGIPIHVRAVPTFDERTVALVSDLYRRKYGSDVHEMLREEVELATVRFHPL